MLTLEAALDVWDGVSVDAVRTKSLALTDFFLECVEAYVPAGRVTSLTPAAHAERGSQVALRCDDDRTRDAPAHRAGRRGRPAAARCGPSGFRACHARYRDTRRRGTGRRGEAGGRPDVLAERLATPTAPRPGLNP
ncbi:Kynureninase [Streptomyces microflavus]